MVAKKKQNKDTDIRKAVVEAKRPEPDAPVDPLQLIQSRLVLNETPSMEELLLLANELKKARDANFAGVAALEAVKNKAIENTAQASSQITSP